MILLPSICYKPIIGVTLIYAAIRFIKDAAEPDYIIKPPLMPIVLILGAGLGFFQA